MLLSMDVCERVQQIFVVVCILLLLSASLLYTHTYTRIHTHTHAHTHTQEDVRNPSPVTQSPAALPLPHADRRNLTNMSVCTACRVQYQQLVNYYLQYKKNIKPPGCVVCADIEDHVSMSSWHSLKFIQTYTVISGFLVPIAHCTLRSLM